MEQQTVMLGGSHHLRVVKLLKNPQLFIKVLNLNKLPKVPDFYVPSVEIKTQDEPEAEYYHLQEWVILGNRTFVYVLQGLPPEEVKRLVAEAFGC